MNFFKNKFYFIGTLRYSVFLSQEEMTRLQENLEKLKVQGSEDDSDEKVM